MPCVVIRWQTCRRSSPGRPATRTSSRCTASRRRPASALKVPTLVSIVTGTSPLTVASVGGSSTSLAAPVGRPRGTRRRPRSARARAGWPRRHRRCPGPRPSRGRHRRHRGARAASSAAGTAMRRRDMGERVGEGCSAVAPACRHRPRVQRAVLLDPQLVRQVDRGAHVVGHDADGARRAGAAVRRRGRRPRGARRVRRSGRRDGRASARARWRTPPGRRRGPCCPRRGRARPPAWLTTVALAVSAMSSGGIVPSSHCWASPKT